MINGEKVLNWLNEVYVTPSRAFNEYTEDELKMIAHDTLVFLKKQQETILSLQGTIRKLNAALGEQPEQKHGHWKLVQYYDDEHWQCSACGCEWYLASGNPEENNMHYCAECGAIMDEEVMQDGRREEAQKI